MSQELHVRGAAHTMAAPLEQFYCHTIQCVHASLALGAENAYSIVWPVRKFRKTKKYSTYWNSGPILHPVVTGQLANYGTPAR